MSNTFRQAMRLLDMAISFAISVTVALIIISWFLASAIVDGFSLWDWFLLLLYAYLAVNVGFTMWRVERMVPLHRKRLMRGDMSMEHTRRRAKRRRALGQ